MSGLLEHLDRAGKNGMGVCLQASQEIRRLQTNNQMLLEALQELCDNLGSCGMTEKARYVITKIEDRSK